MLVKGARVSNSDLDLQKNRIDYFEWRYYATKILEIVEKEICRKHVYYMTDTMSANITVTS